MEFHRTGWVIRAIFLLLLSSFASTSQAQGTLPFAPALVKVQPPTQAGMLRDIGGYPASFEGATATRLADGRVLVFGDDPVDYSRSSSLTFALRDRWQPPGGGVFLPGAARNPLLWEPQRQAWTKLAPPPGCSGARYRHTATALPDGKVLIAGGLCDEPEFGEKVGPVRYAKLSVWNGTTKAWEAAPELHDPRVFHTATLMKDGSVLLIGGESDPAFSGKGAPVLSSVERYDGKTVIRLPPMHVARAGHTATLLRNGTVLVVGGFGRNGKAIAAVELWDPLVRSWVELPPLHTARYAHSATLLDDQRVLVAGGVGLDGEPLKSVELWDPSTGRWSIGNPLPHPLAGQSALRLADGDALLAGNEWRLSNVPTVWGPVDWGLLWDKSSGTWISAARARSKVPPPTLVSLDDGSVLAFGSDRILRWRPRRAVHSPPAPTWYDPTAMAALSDGDVMVAGETRPNLWTANVWHPASDTWTFAGDLAQQTLRYVKAIQLSAGQVVFVGLQGNDRVYCRVSDLSHSHWTDCAPQSLPHRFDTPMGLGLLPDGRAVLLTSTDDAFIYDQASNHWSPADLHWDKQDIAFGTPIRAEHSLATIRDRVQDTWVDISAIGADYWMAGYTHAGHDVLFDGFMPPSLLWNPHKRQWAYIFPDQRMDRRSRWLPDGCALSWSPLGLFNPNTGDVVGLDDPGIGIRPWDGSMLVLADGTAVFSGAPDGGTGPGFFHRRVSCAGFAPAQPGELSMPGVYKSASAKSLNKPKPAVSRAGQVFVSSPIAALRAYFRDNPWPLRVVLGVLLLYVLLRLLVLPLIRRMARRTISQEHLAMLTRELPRSYAWGTRAVIYGALAIVCLPALMSYLLFHRSQGVAECLEDTRACLDPHTGILKSIPSLERTSPGHPQPTIPCRFVGLWSLRQGELMFRITMKGDGTYSEQPNVAGFGNPSGYRGYWMVQGNSMVWRDLARPEIGPDINPIFSESDGRFVLVEQNGRHTLFERIKAIVPDRCK